MHFICAALLLKRLIRLTEIFDKEIPEKMSTVMKNVHVTLKYSNFTLYHTARMCQNNNIQMTDQIHSKVTIKENGVKVNNNDINFA